MTGATVRRFVIVSTSCRPDNHLANSCELLADGKSGAETDLLTICIVLLCCPYILNV